MWAECQKWVSLCMHINILVILLPSIIIIIQVRETKRSQRCYAKTVFTKWKWKDRRKIQPGNYSHFMNCNLSSLCMVAVPITWIYRDVIKIQYGFKNLHISNIYNTATCLRVRPQCMFWYFIVKTVFTLHPKFLKKQKAQSKTQTYYIFKHWCLKLRYLYMYFLYIKLHFIY